MRNQLIRVLLTPEERTEIERHAAQCGLPLSTFIRLAVMEKMNGKD